MVRLSGTNASTFFAGLLAVAAFGVWTFTGFVNRNLAALPIETIPNPAGQAKPFDTKGWINTLAPVWVQNGQKAILGPNREPASSVFAGPPDLAPAPAPVNLPAPPNYASLLSTVMRIDGIAAEGAFVNGKFYRIGEPISDFEYPEGARQIIPVIVYVSDTKVVVKHGNYVTELSV